MGFWVLEQFWAKANIFKNEKFYKIYPLNFLKFYVITGIKKKVKMFLFVLLGQLWLCPKHTSVFGYKIDMVQISCFTAPFFYSFSVRTVGSLLHDLS